MIGAARWAPVTAPPFATLRGHACGVTIYALPRFVPKAGDGPAAGAECAGDEAVAGAVGGELFPPEGGVGFGLSRVERTTVPETAVDEDGEFAGGENEVGLAEERSVSSPAGGAVGEEDRDELQFAVLLLHAPRQTVAERHAWALTHGGHHGGAFFPGEGVGRVQTRASRRLQRGRYRR